LIGELNLDLIVTGAPGLPELGTEKIVGGMALTLGSSSAIMACQLARLGDDVRFISKAGADDFGRRALDFLRAREVPTEFVTVDASLSTGLTISIAVGNDRAQLTHLGCIEEMRAGDLDFNALRDRQHLHVSAFYAQRNLRADVGRIFARAHERGLTTSLDTGWPQEEAGGRDFTAALAQTDIFLPNEVEAMRLSGQDSVEKALDWLAERAPTVVIKLGTEGAVARRGEETVRRPAFEIEPVDTTGAGDSFNGGFLHAYLAGASLADSLDLGNACGALSTRAPGGTTSQATLAEAEELVGSAPRRRPA